MGLIRMLLAGCPARQRQLDIEVLWPSICQNAHDAETARRAFALHASRDGAWLALPDDEMQRQIAELHFPPLATGGVQNLT